MTRNEQILELYKTMSAGAVARKMHLSRSVVTGVVYRAGVRRRLPRQKELNGHA